MFAALLVVLSVVAAIAAENNNLGTREKPVYGGDIQLQDNVEDVVLSPMPQSDSLPTNWDWRTTGYMTTDLNQHIPVYWYDQSEVITF